MRSAKPSLWFGWLFRLFGRCTECGDHRNEHLHTGACTLDRDDEFCKGERHHWFGEGK